MKPKRRTAFSPKNSRVLCPPHAKRPRLGSSSPVGRRSSSESSIIRSPEFLPFNYNEKCPVFTQLLQEESGDTLLESSDLLALQHELEAMLTDCSTNARRVHGDVHFLKTGEFPKEELQRRLMPHVKTRRHCSPPESPTAILEKEGICGLPTEDLEDDIDTNPPAHLPSRFWGWCKEDFLKNVDAAYLEDFKVNFLDKYSSSALKQYYVNEPWKYRRRPSRRSGNTSKSKRASDFNSEKRDLTSPNRKTNLLQRGNKHIDSGACNGNKIFPMVGSIVFAACREKRNKESKPVVEIEKSVGRRHSERIQHQHEHAICIKTEPLDSDSDDLRSAENGTSPVNGNSPRVLSPRLVKKEREEEDWDRAGPSNGYHSPVCEITRSNGSVSFSQPNGRFNGEQKCSQKRRNGEHKKNGVISPIVCNGKATEGFHFGEEADKNGEDEEEADGSLVDLSLDFDPGLIGAKIVQKLISGGVLSTSALHIYEEMTKTEAEDDSTEVTINEEGRSDAEDQSMDALSEELERCQLELHELEPKAHAMISMAWRRARAQFAYWETSEQLHEADYDLFRLGVNMYREFPRRLPNQNEQPHLKSALRVRNGKSRIHYGRLYKRHPKYRLAPPSKQPSPAT